jgi:hypothetical protein
VLAVRIIGGVVTGDLRLLTLDDAPTWINATGDWMKTGFVSGRRVLTMTAFDLVQ